MKRSAGEIKKIQGAGAVGYLLFFSVQICGQLHLFVSP